MIKPMEPSDVAIVIPIYKTHLNHSERISLDRLLKTLSRYPIYFFAADDVAFDYLPKDRSITRFNKNYFKDLHGYSRLLRSATFYDRFKKFEYILIAQLDTFIFKDNLLDWCKRNYDYIGAPWIFEVSALHKYINKNLPFYYKNRLLRKVLSKDYLVGNGGLSLRKVSSFREILNNNLNKQIIKDYELSVKKQVEEEHIDAADNEDVFWCLYVPKFIQKMYIPSYRVALKFSFETEPKKCFLMNKQELPFGCHAWEKHGLDFWRPIIESYGYKP